MLRAQDSFPFPHMTDESRCASVVKHLGRRVKPTHIVTIGAKSFRVCTPCMRPYEAMRTATIQEIKGETR